MKRKNLKSLQLNKKVVTNFIYCNVQGGGINLTADVKDCPNNTLLDTCIDTYKDTYWCDTECSILYVHCCALD